MRGEPFDFDAPPRRRRRSIPVWVWILAAVAGSIVVVAGMLAILLLAGRTTSDEKPAVTLDAEPFMAEIEGNPASATKYQGKVVRIAGRLKEVTSNIHHQCFLTFDGKGRSPRCFFNDPADVAHLKKGDAVILQGRLSTDGGMVDLVGCRLIR